MNGTAAWNKMSKASRVGGKYYIFSDEVEIIQDRVNDIVDVLDEQNILIDFGTGSEEAVYKKIGCLLNSCGPKIKGYAGVDIVASLLDRAREIFEQDFSEIYFQALNNDFFEDHLVFDLPHRRVAVIFGQTMFNLMIDPLNRDIPIQTTVDMLRKLKKHLRANDYLIVTQDCNRNEESIKESYDEQKDVWKTVLYRIERDLPVEGNFNPENFDFDPYWIPETSALVHSFIALKPMQFKIGKESFSVHADNRFFLHTSYKFETTLFRQMAVEADFLPISTYVNDKDRMALHILKATDPKSFCTSTNHNLK